MRFGLICLLMLLLTGLTVGSLSAQRSGAGLDEATAEAVYAARDKAVEQILKASRSEDAYLRANAIEAAEPLSDRLPALVKLGLEDDDPVVRFAALVVIGRQRMTDLRGSLRRHLADGSDSVKAAAMYALTRCGEAVDLTPLAGMLASGSATTRGNAAMVLGRLGDRSAAPLLKEMARVPMRRAPAALAAVVRLQFAEAVLRLGDESELDAVRAGAYSQFDEVRVLAVKIMGQARDGAMLPAFVKLMDEKEPIEVRLAAAEALARLGRSDGRATVLAGMASERATVRAQAALVAWRLPTEASARAAIDLLDDENSAVRLAAAAAILRFGRNPAEE